MRVTPAASSAVVMVVDDDAAVRTELAGALERRGYAVLAAASGEEGLELLDHESPRLIVLDYWMPGLDGTGFLSGMRQTLSRRPPVMLMMLADDDRRLVRDLGVDVQVEKPVDMKRFLMLVDAMVRGASDPERCPPRARTERRTHVRRKLAFPVEVRAAGCAGEAVRSIDWSAGGVCLEMEAAPRPGAYLAIAVSLANGRRVELDARVRYAGQGKIGAQFFALDRTRRLALEEILERQP
jgi:CheY-like chemotaxis protein